MSKMKKGLYVLSGTGTANNGGYYTPFSLLTNNGSQKTVHQNSGNVAVPDPGDYRLSGLPDDIGNMSDAHLDLLIMRDRLQIEKENSQRSAGVGNFQIDNYDRAIAEVDRCLANINNGDYIVAVGEAMVGKAKKKGGKTGAGKFFQKIGKGIKKGLKAVAKVATAPVRLIMKGAMEIYLPKSAMLFLYLFVDEKIKMPDVMARKRKKAEKFKKFVVSGLGMKDKHFMGIVRNALTKRLGMSPESYMQKTLQTRVSGIGDPNAKKRRVQKKAHPNNRNAKAKYVSSRDRSGGPAIAPISSRDTANGNLTLRTNSVPLDLQAKMYAGEKGNPAPVRNKGQGLLNALKSGKDVFDAAKKGDIIGAAIAAIQWLIGKIGGKNKPDKITADDFPDIEADAANVFEYEDMHADYSNLDGSKKNLVKEVATELMEGGANDSTIRKVITEKLSFLNPNQAEEVAYEVKEGPEALDESDAKDLALSIKKEGLQLDNAEKNGGGAAGTGLCSC